MTEAIYFSIKLLFHIPPLRTVPGYVRNSHVVFGMTYAYMLYNVREIRKHTNKSN